MKSECVFLASSSSTAFNLYFFFKYFFACLLFFILLRCFFWMSLHTGQSGRQAFPHRNQKIKKTTFMPSFRLLSPTVKLFFCTLFVDEGSFFLHLFINEILFFSSNITIFSANFLFLDILVKNLKLFLLYA